MRIIKKLAFLFLALLFYTSSNAFQDSKLPGYIINNDGERIEGYIKPGSITDNEVKVLFYEFKSSKKKVYKPKQLQGYGYESILEDDLGLEEKEWVHYERMKVEYPAKPFGATTLFVEREEQGEVSLFCHYIEIRNNPKKPYRYVYYIKDQKGKIFKVEEDRFEYIARNIFKNYDALRQRIGKKDFLYRNLDRMVRDYNYWVVNQHDKGEYRVALKN